MLLNEVLDTNDVTVDNEQDVDWIGDLKFYIDQSNNLLEKFIFPVVEKHKKYVGNPDVYKLYIKPLTWCMFDYVRTYDITDKNQKFSMEDIVELAKYMAYQQEEFIKNGDYD